jgi:dihydroneopterin triphosphate diphosphatase
MTPMVCRIVELCVFRFAGSDPEYLMLRRAATERLHPGLWQFVTGGIEDGEKAWQASLRELREETGLRPVRFWVVPHVGRFYDPEEDVVHIMPFFAAQVAPGSQPVLSEEHREFAWLPLREATRRLVWPGQREGLGIVHREVVAGTEAGRRTQIPVPETE